MYYIFNFLKLQSWNKGRQGMTSSAPHSTAGTPLDGHPAQFPSRNCRGRRRERVSYKFTDFFCLVNKGYRHAIIFIIQFFSAF